MIKFENGIIKTPHGEINTPGFVFCATQGAIKGINSYDIKAQLIFVNTYHLMHKADTIEKAGGIHKFMNWNGPIISDSGGFQVFSLGHGFVSDEIKGIRNRSKNYVKISEEGVLFQDPENGSKHMLSPERSMEIQKKLGVDFIVAFDECTPSHASYEYTKQSLFRTHRWHDRGLETFQKISVPYEQKIYGVMQGGIYEDLRILSAKYLENNKFFGIGIGGSLGKTKEEMYKIVRFSSELLGKERPVHLLGIGRIEDLLHLSPYANTFDCVEPTRIARHGIALTKKGRINLRKNIYVDDFTPIALDCLCLACKNYTKSYVHHLIRAKEMSGLSLILIHNMFQMNLLMTDIRKDYNFAKEEWNNYLI